MNLAGNELKANPEFEVFTEKLKEISSLWTNSGNVRPRFE